MGLGAEQAEHLDNARDCVDEGVSTDLLRLPGGGPNGRAPSLSSVRC